MHEVRSVKKCSFGALIVAGAVPAFIACGGSNNGPTSAQVGYSPASASYPPSYPPTSYPPTSYPQPNPYPYGTQPTAPQTAPAPPASATSTAPPLGQILTDPRTWSTLLTTITGAPSGALINPSTVPDALEAGLKAQQMRLAPTMTPEGQELKQALAAGQHATMMVPMQAGKCYVIIGFSQPGDVKDLDLYLMTGAFGSYTLLTAQDTSHNNAPFLASDNASPPTPMCPTGLIPLQYKLDVFAKDGAGGVAVQVFSKSHT